MKITIKKLQDEILTLNKRLTLEKAVNKNQSNLISAQSEQLREASHKAQGQVERIDALLCALIVFQLEIRNLQLAYKKSQVGKVKLKEFRFDEINKIWAQEVKLATE